MCRGKKIIHYPIAEMCGLDTPEDLQQFIAIFSNKEFMKNKK
jgi:hypothetical protein